MRMNMKKLAVLLAAAALTLCVLAGCGGSRALTSVLLDLLEGQYANVQVETDPELEALLRRAVRESDSEAEVLAALEKALGVSTSFANLAYGQQGDDAFDLIFYPGDDPEAAARSAYVTWSSVLSRLPGDGRYSADLAMIEAENGYYILVRTTVTQAARPDQDEPEDPYTKTGENSYTINTPDGLGRLLSAIGENGIATAHIILESDVTLPASWPDGDEAIEFSGILDGNGKTITIGGTRSQGLFKEITSNNSRNRSGETTGTVKNLHVQVTENINADTNAGAVAGANDGAIENCTVTVNMNCSISSNYGSTGAVAGSNYGTIANCNVTICGSINNTTSAGNAGGVAGYSSGTVSDCKVNHGMVTAEGSNACAGGMVGLNLQNGTVSNCTAANVKVEATSTDSDVYAGGVVGRNSGKVQGTCTATNVNVTATTEANDDRAYAGGVVGFNNGDTVEGTWSGNGKITAKVGETYIATVPTTDGGGTATNGDAYAGTKIGYDRDEQNPVACGGGGQQQGSIID